MCIYIEGGVPRPREWYIPYTLYPYPRRGGVPPGMGPSGDPLWDPFEPGSLMKRGPKRGQKGVIPGGGVQDPGPWDGSVDGCHDMDLVS